jgi:hypothetical protein
MSNITIQRNPTPLEKYFDEMRAEITQLRTALAEARADAGRLQWLQEHWCYAMWSGKERPTMRTLQPPNGDGDLRAAIDAARANGNNL